MVVCLKKRFATAKRPLAWCIQNFPKRKNDVKILVERINLAAVILL